MAHVLLSKNSGRSHRCRRAQRMTQVVARHVDKTSGSVSYSFGGTPDLTLPKVVDALEQQSCIAIVPLKLFRGLFESKKQSSKLTTRRLWLPSRMAAGPSSAGWRPLRFPLEGHLIVHIVKTSA